MADQSTVGSRSSEYTGTPEQVRVCCSLWQERLMVYRQLVVWSWRVLTLRNGSFAYFMAIMAVSNVIIMGLKSAELSSLMLVGVVLLLTAGLCAVAIFTSQSRYILLTEWGNQEDSDFQAVCREVAKIHCILTNVVEKCLAVRSKESKKFYGYGLLLAIAFSYVGTLLTGAVLVHSAVTLLLLSPLAIHHGLLDQLLTQNWAQVWDSLVTLGHSMWQSLIHSVSQLHESLRGHIVAAAAASTQNRTRGGSNTATQPQPGDGGGSKF